MSVLLDICGLYIDFDTRYPEYVAERCRNYMVDRKSVVPDMKLRSSDEDIVLANRDNVGLEEAELYAMTIPLSEKLPELGRLMTHGVAIACDGKSFIFTAESGVGKSTHAFLWQKYLGEERVRVINGDKPIIWFKDGDIYASGSPWSGKEHLDENVSVPLRGICLLKRLGQSGVPSIKRASREEALDFLMHQIFIPHCQSGKIRTLMMLEELYDKVPIYHLTVDMSREAVMVSSNELLSDL
ncbi:MAG: hypothetical protein MJZ93_02985 [Paludibacteraceae bacterium]|nr:hypothetical protein [Paludibacteraceae bacterium]